jgi:hypothetical protein
MCNITKTVCAGLQWQKIVTGGKHLMLRELITKLGVRKDGRKTVRP